MNTKLFKPIILITYIFLLITLLISCKDDDDDNPTPEQQLPPITQTGANTFGCLINGKLFIPRGGNGTISNPDYALIFWGGGDGPNYIYNEIDVHDYKSERTANLLLHIQNLAENQQGLYVIDESNGFSNLDGLDHNYMHCRIWREEIGNYQWYLSYENSGIINITNYNFNSRLVSGTFNGKVRNFYSPHDTIEITNGRFDINWSTVLLADFL